MGVKYALQALKSPSPIKRKGLGVEGVTFLLTLLFLLTACAPTPAAPPVKRVALLAPFEGRYREIGYDAIYPVRLALKDAASDIVLVTADDGGTPQAATTQARRLAADSTLLAALVIGPIATQPDVLEAFGDVPVIVIGQWNAAPSDGVYVLASEKLASLRTSDAPTLGIAVDTSSPVAGGELFALKQYPQLRRNLDGLSVILSATPPEAAFSERLIASDLFVPVAGALATVTYDAGGMIHTAVTANSTRETVRTALETLNYDGLNGRIAFTAKGWWQDAPVVEYTYANGILITSPAP